jgi:hypothetical protein
MPPSHCMSLLYPIVIYIYSINFSHLEKQRIQARLYIMLTKSDLFYHWAL